MCIRPRVAVAVVREQSPNRLVRRHLIPHVGENRDDIFEPPEEVIGVGEWLPGRRPATRVGLTADEVGLPRRQGRDARYLLDLALGRNRVGCLRRRRHEHEIDFVGYDQLLGNFRRAVRVGLAILDRDLDRQSGATDFDAALHCIEEIGNDEIISFAECRERPGLRADIADLEGISRNAPEVQTPNRPQAPHLSPLMS
jgi:hypothetical protein